jgi:hypothetical protein
VIATCDGHPDIPFCVLIPTRGRWDRLAKTLKKMPFLDARGVVFGVEKQEHAQYTCLHDLRHAQVITYDNPEGSVAVARERLRKFAIQLSEKSLLSYAVVTDDNAVYSMESLNNLVAATATYERMCGRYVVMAGMHNTAPHFDRNLIQKKIKVDRFTSYPNVAMIFQCYPMALYETYTYPADSYGLDDRHFFLWAISQGVRDFRVCMDAPFNKARYQEGGQGSVDARMEKCGRAIARLATDFPRYVGAKGTLSIAWQFILAAEAQGGPVTADRLAGGAMRKGADLVKSKRVTIKRK